MYARCFFFKSSQFDLIDANLPRFFATMCAQVALESLFVGRAWTLRIVWDWFGMVEQLLWPLVQVFGSWVWLIHPGKQTCHRGSNCQTYQAV